MAVMSVNSNQQPRSITAWVPVAAFCLTLLSLFWAAAMFYGTANAAQQDVTTAKQDIINLRIAVNRVEAAQLAMTETLKDIKEDLRILRNRKE
jgi:hypothetical protein